MFEQIAQIFIAYNLSYQVIVVFFML